jgi:hypothetical protein
VRSCHFKARSFGHYFQHARPRRAFASSAARRRADRINRPMSAIGTKQTSACALHMSAFDQSGHRPLQVGDLRRYDGRLGSGGRHEAAAISQYFSRRGGYVVSRSASAARRARAADRCAASSKRQQRPFLLLTQSGHGPFPEYFAKPLRCSVLGLGGGNETTRQNGKAVNPETLATAWKSNGYPQGRYSIGS